MPYERAVQPYTQPCQGLNALRKRIVRNHPSRSRRARGYVLKSLKLEKKYRFCARHAVAAASEGLQQGEAFFMCRLRFMVQI